MLVFFFGMLALPTANENLHLIKENKNSENRTKLKKPEFNDTIEKYIKAYDDYYTDNFNLRDNFIELLNKLQFSFFNVSSVPDIVTVGKDGWFYEASCALNYKGANHFTKKEVEKFRNELIKRTKWAAKRGIKYYLVLVPNKMEMYPEHLPRQIIQTSDVFRYDQIASLNNDSTINIIDVRENLLRHKNDGWELYQHTDDHWNELGAYYGYQEIMNRVSKDFPELKPIPLNMLGVSVEQRYGNMATMLNVEKEYPEQYIKLTEKYKIFGHDGIKKKYKTLPLISEPEYEIVKENDNGKKLKCLIIRDSFTMLMIRFFQEQFAKLVIIHDQWMYRVREDVVIKEKPDIILNIALETRIKNIIDFPFTLSADEQIEQSIAIKAANGKYFCAEPNHTIVVNREKIGSWETFTLVKYENNECAFLSCHNFFLSSDLSGKGDVTAFSEMASDWEKFKLIELGDDFVAFKAGNGKYLSLDEKTKNLFATADKIGANEKFKITVVK